MDTLGRYRIDTKLAEGDMGSVCLTSDVNSRFVLLKMPHRHDTLLLTVLGGEARSGVRLRHPSIVETLDILVEEGRGALVVGVDRVLRKGAHRQAGHDLRVQGRPGVGGGPAT